MLLDLTDEELELTLDALRLLRLNAIQMKNLVSEGFDDKGFPAIAKLLGDATGKYADDLVPRVQQLEDRIFARKRGVGPT